MKLIPVLLLTVLSACSIASHDGRQGRLELLNQIAAKCHLPSSAFKLVGVDDLHFVPPADAKYENVNCALTELKNSPFSMKLGLIGNETHQPENK